MIISCDTIDIKDEFLRWFWKPIFSMYFDYGFFPLSPFFSGNNNLETHISNLSSP
jgi:hypothetical protein